MRRPSAFLVCAAALAIGVAVQHTLWFVAEGVDAFAFIGAACVALGLGWAAHAITLWKAAGRAVVVAGGLFAGWVLALAFLTLTPASVDITFSGLWRDQDGEGRSSIDWLVTQFAPTAMTLAAVSVPFGVAAWAYGALPGDRPLRLLPAAVALAPVTLWVFVAWDEGLLSFACTMAAFAWFVWALRRSRAVRSAPSGAGPGDDHIATRDGRAAVAPDRPVAGR